MPVKEVSITSQSSDRVVNYQAGQPIPQLAGTTSLTNAKFSHVCQTVLVQ